MGIDALSKCVWTPYLGMQQKTQSAMEMKKMLYPKLEYTIYGLHWG